MTKLDYAHPSLRREIGLFGAVMLGLGSILGTGVFVSLAHATELAGPWVLLAIVLAGLLAYCNAMSSAQLAAAYPVSGGTYEYGYRVLNPALGFTAGWMFLLAKSASAATAALGLQIAVEVEGRGYSIQKPPGPFQLLEIAGFEWLLECAPYVAVLLLTILALCGVRRSMGMNLILVATTMFGLLLFVAYFGVQIDRTDFLQPRPRVSLDIVLYATAFCFVAFTGYGRLATLGEEVRSPGHTIPRAILWTLGLSIGIYLAVAAVLFAVVFGWQPSEPMRSLTDVAAMSNHFWLRWSVTLAAVTAMLGVLLNLILGLSRVWLAMGRRGDMPRILARVNEKTSTPVPATILSGVVIALLVLVGDVRTTWSFSAFTVLIYYAITNWAALKLAPEHRRYPRFLAWVGLFACLSLAWFVEMKVWIAGTILIAVGLIWFRIRRRWRTDVG